MKEKDLIHHCRYYKGENENPYKDGDKALFWDYEQKWIEFSIKKDDILGNALDDYIAAGLSEFEMFDDTPVTLKALLFNRYLHWSSGDLLETAKDFRKFYLNCYKKEA